jgi:hypothetical protein
MNSTYPYVRHIQHCMLALLLLVLCLIGAAPVTAAQSAEADPGLPFDKLTNRRDEGFAAIDAYIEAQMRKLRIPGLALVGGTQVIFELLSHFFGVGPLEVGVALWRDHAAPFQGVSTTFTASSAPFARS